MIYWFITGSLVVLYWLTLVLNSFNPTMSKVDNLCVMLRHWLDVLEAQPGIVWDVAPLCLMSWKQGRWQFKTRVGG